MFNSCNQQKCINDRFVVHESFGGVSSGVHNRICSTLSVFDFFSFREKNRSVEQKLSRCKDVSVLSLSYFPLHMNIFSPQT